MHKRLHTFADNKNIIFDLQFGFRQQYSTSHALTNITGSIRKALDDENICFAGLRKAFDTVYFKIPVAKLNDYGVCGVANHWFKPCLSNRNHGVSVNGYESGLAGINCGVLQECLLGSLLFLLYINDLNQAIKFCKVHHLADGTKLLCLSNSIKN